MKDSGAELEGNDLNQQNNSFNESENLDDSIISYPTSMH